MPRPPKPKDTGEDLAEVERALSVLKGRHPDHERVRREDEAARTKRKEEIDAASRKESAKVIARRVRTVVIAAAALVVATALGMIFRSEFARRSRIEEAGVTYRSMGFVVVETSSRSTAGSLDAMLESGCHVVVSTGTGPIRVEHPTGVVSGPGPVVLCTCQPERVRVSSDADERGGLAMLRIDATAIGGSKAFTSLPFKPGTVGLTDQACAEATFDAWLDAKHYAKDHVSADRSRELARAFPGAKYAPLGALGFTSIAAIAPEAPFVVVEMPAESCLVAVPSDDNDRVSLRTKGGSYPIAPSQGAIAWCASGAATLVVGREGRGIVNVATASAARTGGLFGLLEVAEGAGLSIVEARMPPSDRGWMAKQALLASAVPEALVSIANAPDLPPDPEARIAAVSVETPNALVAELPADTYSFCSPPIDRAPRSLCAFSSAQHWHIGAASAVGGLARAKLPFWLLALEGVAEPAGLKIEVELLALARRLRRDGFEPTTLEAITELPNGAEVLGRTGEDAIVAFGLVAASPWVLPYTDGPLWTIQGAPQIVPLKPLERVTLTTGEKKPRRPSAKEVAARRTVVFRRAIKQIAN